jgi:hypothetical protein
MDRENTPEDHLYLHPEWIIDRVIRTEAGIRTMHDVFWQP